MMAFKRARQRLRALDGIWRHHRNACTSSNSATSFPQPDMSLAQPDTSFPRLHTLSPRPNVVRPAYTSFAQPYTSFAQPYTSFAQPYTSFAQPYTSFAQPYTSFPRRREPKFHHAAIPIHQTRTAATHAFTTVSNNTHRCSAGLN
jgi:hypothetical protein